MLQGTLFPRVVQPKLSQAYKSFLQVVLTLLHLLLCSLITLHYLVFEELKKINKSETSLTSLPCSLLQVLPRTPLIGLQELTKSGSCLLTSKVLKVGTLATLPFPSSLKVCARVCVIFFALGLQPTL